MPIIPPRFIPPLPGKITQPVKYEHPMQAEWNEIKGRAREQGLLHNDGTFANPPQSGGALLNRPMNRRLEIVVSKSGRSNSAMIALMKTIEKECM
jgi:hypothetical protein